MSQEHGHNLQSVQMLLKRNQVGARRGEGGSATLSVSVRPSGVLSSVPQTLQREVEGHQPRVDDVLERGRRMASAAEGRPEAGRVAEQLKELEDAWDRLQDEMSKRRGRLDGSNLAQQYYNDADEAEAWIWEQELYMIAEEKAKVGEESRHRRRRALSSSSLSSLAPPG